jgi:phosphoribosylanthranilate isomerase
MTWIKICGMTNLDDTLAAVDAGADAVGFVFYEKSPRHISVEAARKIVENLPESVEKIGVFVNGNTLDPNRVLLQAGLTGTQQYISGEGGTKERGGTRTLLGLGALPKRARFLTALPMKLICENEEQIASSAAGFAKWGKNLPEEISFLTNLMNIFVLDSGDLQVPGGTGKTFDWKKAVPIAEGMRQGGARLVVAGGLTAENVTEAMETLRPWGVDVVSGVEASPGKKDPAKVRAFVRAVREKDRKVG